MIVALIAGSKWGHGRLYVLSIFMGLGTLAFLGHDIPTYHQNIFGNVIHPKLVLIWHISMRIIYAISLGVVAPTLDGLALAHLDCADNTSTVNFGNERLYGAISWGLGSFVAGVGIDYYGGSFYFLYTFLIISTIISYLAIWIYAWGLDRDSTGVFKKYSVSIVDDINDGMAMNGVGSQLYQNQQIHSSHSSSNTNGTISNAELLSIVCKTNYGKAVIFFTFICAMGIAVVDNLAFIFFNTLGADPSMEGLTVVFTVGVEVPAFLVAPKLLDRHGPGQMLLWAGLAYVIRVLGYSLVPYGHMYIILLLELLHGITYAGHKAGSVEYISSRTPAGYEAAGQGLLVFVSYSGIVAGLIYAGWIQEVLGARVMFRSMAAIVSIGMVVPLIAELVCDKDEEIPDATKENRESNEANRFLTKSDSCASSSSAFADISTSNFIKKQKYDSLGKDKWVKDW
jgi:hypothetical protein